MSRGRRRVLVVLVTVVASAGTACSSGRSNENAAPHQAAATIRPLPPPRSGGRLIATANVAVVSVFATPLAAAPSQTLPNPWFIGGDTAQPVPLTFLVEDRVKGWVEVDLPLRPTGSAGWIREGDVRLATTPYRIEVHLRMHTLDVYDGTSVVMHEIVAVGAPATPTPVGHFFVRALLRAPRPGTVYGPYAYALSGFSPVLETFDGSDAEIGIHGNDDASVLGRDVSHGCIRMSNDGITRLAGRLPLGTPVDIDP